MPNRRKVNGSQAIVQPESHANRLSKQLLALSINVTAQDRTDAIAEFSFTKGTLSKYLNGHILNLDTAIDLTIYFKARVDQREKIIDDLCEQKIKG